LWFPTCEHIVTILFFLYTFYNCFKVLATNSNIWGIFSHDLWVTFPCFACSVFCMTSNFSVYTGHVGWYIVKILMSVLFLGRVFLFILVGSLLGWLHLQTLSSL
jgi:hypothetical protein